MGVATSSEQLHAKKVVSITGQLYQSDYTPKRTELMPVMLGIHGKAEQ